jgi:hypothetical protein
LELILEPVHDRVVLPILALTHDLVMHGIPDRIISSNFQTRKDHPTPRRIGARREAAHGVVRDGVLEPVHGRQTRIFLVLLRKQRLVDLLIHEMKAERVLVHHRRLLGLFLVHEANLPQFPLYRRYRPKILVPVHELPENLLAVHHRFLWLLSVVDHLVLPSLLVHAYGLWSVLVLVHENLAKAVVIHRLLRFLVLVLVHRCS